MVVPSPPKSGREILSLTAIIRFNNRSALATNKKVLEPHYGGTSRTAPDSLDPSRQGNPTFPGIKETIPQLRNPEGSGRFSDSRIDLVAIPSHHAHRDSGNHGFRPRLQRRDRDGLTPSSLLNPLAQGYLNPLVIKEPEIADALTGQAFCSRFEI